MENKEWRELASKTIIRTPLFTLFRKDFRRPDGTTVKDYYLMEKPSSVHIAAITSEGKIVLIKHYRPGLGEVTIELPAGSIKTKEAATTACERELLEETGYEASSLREISRFTQDTSRFIGCRCHLFIARNLKKTGERMSQEAKEIEVVEIDISEAVGMIKKGRIKDLPTIAGILLSQLFIYLPIGL